jgi:hypothetical protein
MAFPEIKEALENIVKPGGSNTHNKPLALDPAVMVANTLLNSYYMQVPRNWWRLQPYGFRVTFRNNESYVLLLPISPQNLSVQTHYAVNVIPTLYGTIEEHSEQRYFDITINGTTGIAPKYSRLYHGPNIMDSKQLWGRKNLGRLSFGDSNGWTIRSQIAGGFFGQTLGMINAIGKSANDLINGKDKTYNETGVATDETGYAAFHKLYKFFLAYKGDVAGYKRKHPINESDPTEMPHPLVFLNYKDNCEYDCSIQRFSMERSAEDPMLYKYSITLKAYNIRTLNESLRPLDVSHRWADSGLYGVKSSSLLSAFTSTSSSVRNIFGALNGGSNVLGR